MAVDEAWIAVRVPEEAHDKLKQWADDEERSMSYLVRRLVLDALAARDGALGPSR